MRSYLSRLAAPPAMVAKRISIEEAARRHGVNLDGALNVGSKNVRLGNGSVNLDLVPGPGVDIVGDAHKMVDLVGEKSFDVVVICAVLQLCEDPRTVIDQASRVLRPGGWVFIDAPFIQPYFVDGIDLWRFTADGLRKLCEPCLDVVEVKPSIGTAAALGMTLQAALQTMPNKYVSSAVTWGVSSLMWPTKFLPHAHPRTAGAFLLVGRKPVSPEHG